MRIRFLSEQTYVQADPAMTRHFAAGFILDEIDVQEALGLEDRPTKEWARKFLQRWVQRKVAEVIDRRAVVRSQGELQTPDLTKLNREELAKLAVDRGVDIAGLEAPEDIAAALTLADEARGET